MPGVAISSRKKVNSSKAVIGRENCGTYVSFAGDNPENPHPRRALFPWLSDYQIQICYLHI